MRVLALFLVLAGLAPAPELGHEFVQAVEFPYYAYPQQLWERELVWLKNLGIDTVTFSIPWNWHQVEADSLDLAGRTSPRRDLIGLLRLLKRAGLRAWIRPAPPVKGWMNSGYPAGMETDRRALRKWLWDLESALAPFLASHGGPIAFAEGAPGVFDAPSPPLPVTSVSAKDPRALVESRRALASVHGSLVWQDVEDSVIPVGWEAPGTPVFRAGAVSLTGDERTSVMPLRRDALLRRYWGPTLAAMKPAGPVRSTAGKFPAGIAVQQLVTNRGDSALSVVNQSDLPYEGELRVVYPPSGRRITLPVLRLLPGEALWLPVNARLASEGLCRDCSAFANTDHIVYATVELNAVEYENGILAMEFSALRAGEVVLELSRTPSGPLLAAGHPQKFDWDEKTQRARLPIPAGKGPANRVRIGLAIQPPDASAFFVDAKRLILGQKNRIATSYSSEQIAQRSRLRHPEELRAASVPKSPTEIDYDIDVAADVLHGEWVQLALEADGVLMSRARLQLLRPASVRVREAVNLHFGSQAELAVSPAIVPLDAKTGREISVVIQNNYPEIRNYVLEASGAGLEFLPARSEIAIAPGTERDVILRVFPGELQPGLARGKLRVSGEAEIDLPLRFVVIPRGGTVAYPADLDGDGYDEWLLESQKVRAVFSAQDGGRWLEFAWKDSGLNLLPENGALAGEGVSVVRIGSGNTLEFRGGNWVRRINLAGGTLTVEQSTALPVETLRAAKKNDVIFHVTRESDHRAVYSIDRPAE